MIMIKPVCGQTSSGMTHSPSHTPIYLGAATLLAVFALAAGVLADAALAIPIALLALLLLGFLALSGRRRTRQPPAATRRATRPARSAQPQRPDGRPLGDTAEAHDEISPHDLPKDAPGRRAAEAQAARRDGTTRGDRHGGAGGRTLEHDEEVTA